MAFLFVFLAPGSTQAQTSPALDSLRDAKAQILRDLKNLQVARDSATTKKDAILQEITLVSNQIALRSELLRTMNREIKQLEKEIEEIVASIAALEAELMEIQNEFGRLMVATYKAMHSKSTSFYLLSAKSLSQTYKRAMYFQSISEMQEAKVEEIKSKKAELAKKKHELELRKLEKVELAQEEKKERGKLVRLKNDQKKLYEQLRAQEAKIAAQIKSKEKERRALDRAIALEIEKLTAKPEKEDFTALNKIFSKNQGKLPWPLPKSVGTITRHFGRNTLPGSNTEIDLQGIDITTRTGQSIRAIWAGIVAQVMPVPGQGKIVIVQHGDYYSVYANLKDVTVNAGDNISMLDILGTARTDATTSETKVHFQLYKGRTPQDPEKWLARKK